MAGKPTVEKEADKRAVEEIRAALNPPPEMVEHPNLATALAAAQAEMMNPVKDREAKIQSAKGNRTYSYVDLATVLDAVRGPLTRHGIAFVQLGQYQPAGVEVETRLMHGNSGEVLSTTLQMPCTNGAQEIGSAMTYARRYSIQCVCGIFAEVDDDGAAAHASVQTSAPPIPWNKKEAKAADAAADRAFGGHPAELRPDRPANGADDDAMSFYRVLNRAIAERKIDGGKIVTEAGKRTLIENLMGPLPEGPLSSVMLENSRWRTATEALVEHLADIEPSES